MTPNRRWFRFGLATIVALALLVSFFAWRAWCLEWIRQRHEILENQAGGYSLEDAPQAPWMVRVFGEPGYKHIEIMFVAENIHGPLSTEQKLVIERTTRLFPEALVKSRVENPFDP